MTKDHKEFKIWIEENLKKLSEVNNKRKIPRYFAIKKLVDEALEAQLKWLLEQMPDERTTIPDDCDCKHLTNLPVPCRHAQGFNDGLFECRQIILEALSKE